MTQKEALQVLAILKAAYPDRYYGVTEKDALGIVTVWAVQFANISVDIVLMAVNKWISTNQKAPTVADVNAKISSIHWEAYEMINMNSELHPIPEDKLKLYQRIFKETKEYKHSRMAEPTLHQLLTNNSGEGVKMIE